MDGGMNERMEEFMTINYPPAVTLLACFWFACLLWLVDTKSVTNQ